MTSKIRPDQPGWTTFYPLRPARLLLVAVIIGIINTTVPMVGLVDLHSLNSIQWMPPILYMSGRLILEM